MTSDKAFDIFYTAYSGRPPVDAYVRIHPDGRAELYVGTYASVPGQVSDRVGFFGMALPQDTLAGLNAFLLQEKFLGRSQAAPAALPFGTVVRGVSLALGGQKIQLDLSNPGKDPALSKLEEMLMDIMRQVAARPAGAAQATLALTAEGPKLRPRLTIANVGPEPLPLVLFDRSDKDAYLKVEFLFTQPDQWYASVTTSRNDIAPLVKAGSLPGGLKPLAAGAAYQAVLPSFAPPSDDPALQVTANVTLWLPNAVGQGLREAQVRTPAVPARPAP